MYSSILNLAANRIARRCLPCDPYPSRAPERATYLPAVYLLPQQGSLGLSTRGLGLIPDSGVSQL
jgi:hypothetical protein